MASYLEVINKYQSKVIMILCAHAHPGEIRAPKSARYPDLNITIMMTPSVSPIGLMSPAYTILDLNEFKPSATWRFLQMQDYIMYQWPYFNTLNP
jgi:hypothetical protein